MYNNYENGFYVYGLEGPNKNYRCGETYFLKESEFNINKLKYTASMMKERRPSIKEVYVVDRNIRGLAEDYKKSCKGMSIEDGVIFRDELREYGIRVIGWK